MTSANAPRIRILGPLEVAAADGSPAPVPRAKERTLVGVLALARGDVVSRGRLLEELWGSRPPETAANALQVHVSNVRKLLGDATRSTIRTEPAGYRLGLRDCSLDLREFESGIQRAREEHSRGRPERAAADLRAALSLWRGAPLEDVELRGDAQHRVGQLEEARLEAIEELVAAELDLGLHARLVPELQGHVGEHPLHERFREQLMLALYRAGRQADALELYRTTREYFLDVVGVEPSRSLRELERAILNQEPSLGAPAALAPSTRRRRLIVAAHSAVDVDDDGLDAETLEERLLPAVERVAAAYRDAGARVDRHAHGVLAVFGVPSIREDEPLRAARAALQAAALTSAGAEVRTGVASGTAVTGDPESLRLSGPSRRALALALAADAGSVVVDGDLRGVLASAATFRGRRAGPARLVDVGTAARTPSAAPLVGRDEELASLRAALDEAERTSSCVAVLVAGDAGIGKTRLAAEARTELATRAVVLHGRCRDRTGDAFLPLREATGWTESGDADELAQRLAARLEEMSGGRPVAVFFDDVHWAEPAFRTLLERLPEALAGLPVLAVALTRPEGVGAVAWPRVLTLDPLTEAESTGLSLALGASADATERLYARSGGNPLFLEQLLAAGDEDAAVPPTLAALLAARLDAVPGVERRVLEVAAVVDGDFPLRLLERLLPNESGLSRCVRALCDRRLLVEEDGVYAFRHALIRDAAYDSLPRPERATLHERVGNALEQDGADPALVGFQFEAAHGYGGPPELAPRAARQLDWAGRRAYVRGDNASARNLLERAIALTEPVPDADLLLDLSDVLREARDRDGAFAALDRAEPLADDALLRARVAIRRLRLELSAVDFRERPTHRRELDGAIAALEEARDDRSLAEAWLVRAQLDWRLCRAGGTEEALQTAIAYARAAGELRVPGARRVENRCLHTWVGALVFGPTPVETAVERCEAILERPGPSERVQEGARRGLAALHAMAGRFEQARASLARGWELSARLGLANAREGHAEVAAIVELLADRPAEAERELVDAVSSLGARGSSQLPTLKALLAEALRRQGRLEEAAAAAAEASATSEDDLTTLVQWRCVAAKLGGSDAGRLAREAVELAAATDFPNLHGDARLALADVLAAAGDRAAARRARAAARAAYAAKGNVAALRAAGLDRA